MSSRRVHTFLGLALLLVVLLVTQPAAAAGVTPPLYGEPVRLVLPALHVDAEVAALALTDDLAMPVPPSAALVAWYTFSARAGAAGNVVLAGHRDWQGQRGVFAALGNAQAGDEVWLQDTTGTWYRYTVQWSARVPEDTPAVTDWVGYTAQPSLTLITCSGPFDRTTGRYAERTIVRAELVMVVAEV